MSVGKEAAYFDSMDTLSDWGFQRNACDRCGKPNSEVEGLLMQCSRCRNAYYCSVDCFTADTEEHSKWCQVGILPPSPRKTKAASAVETGSKVENSQRKKAVRVSLTSVLEKDCEASVEKMLNTRRSVSSEPLKSRRKKTSTRHSVSSEPGKKSPGSIRTKKSSTRKSVSSVPEGSFEGSPLRTKKVLKTMDAVSSPKITKDDHTNEALVTPRKKKTTRNVTRETDTKKTPTRKVGSGVVMSPGRSMRKSRTLEAVLTPGKKKAIRDSQTVEALISPRKKKATRNSQTLEPIVSTRRKETTGKSSAPGCKLEETPRRQKATKKNLSSDVGTNLEKSPKKVKAKESLYLDSDADVSPRKLKKKNNKSPTLLDPGSHAETSPHKKKPTKIILVSDPRSDIGQSPRRKKAARNSLVSDCSSDYAKSPKTMSTVARALEAPSLDFDKSTNSLKKKEFIEKPNGTQAKPHLPIDKKEKAGLVIAFDWGDDSISGYGSEEDDPFLVESILGPSNGKNDSPESSFSGEIDTCGGFFGQAYSSFNNSAKNNFSLREKEMNTKIGEDGNTEKSTEDFARGINDSSFSQLSSADPRRLRAPPESRSGLIREMSRKSLNDGSKTMSSSLKSCSLDASSNWIESDDDSGGAGYLDHLDSSKRQGKRTIISTFDPWNDDDEDEDDYESDDQSDHDTEEDAALGSSKNIKLRRSVSRSRLMRSSSKGRRTRSYSNVARAEGESTDSSEPEWVRRSPLKQSSRGFRLRGGVCSLSDLDAPVQQKEEVTESLDCMS